MIARRPGEPGSGIWWLASTSGPLLMLLLPSRLRWSRRTTRLLRAAAALQLASIAFWRRRGPDTIGGRIAPWAPDALLGVTLLLVQFELTEEESSVRTAVGGFGLWQFGVAALAGRKGRRRVD